MLGGLLFVGMGIFNAVATWLDPILGHFHNGSASGVLFAILTAAGIIGAAILPGVAAKRDRRRAMLQVTVSVTVVAFLAIAVWHGLVFLGVVLFIEGFVLLAALPVALDWSELHSGPERAGARGRLPAAGRKSWRRSASADCPARDRQSVCLARGPLGGRAGRAGAVHQAARPSWIGRQPWRR